MHVHDAAFEQLYTEYVHRLIRYARAQGQSGDVAEELVQDTFHEAYAQLAHLTEHENPGGWLMQTLKNKIRNYDRARQRERRLMAGWTEEMYAVAALGDPIEQWLVRQQLSDVYRYAAKHFDEQDLRLFRLLLIEGRSHKTAAAQLGITVWNIQKRLERIRKRLREAFPDF